MSRQITANASLFYYFTKLNHLPCLHEVFKALQNRTSDAIIIYTDGLMAMEKFNAPQLSPPQDLDPEAL